MSRLKSIIKRMTGAQASAESPEQMEHRVRAELYGGACYSPLRSGDWSRQAGTMATTVDGPSGRLEITTNARVRNLPEIGGLTN